MDSTCSGVPGHSSAMVSTYNGKSISPCPTATHWNMAPSPVSQSMTSRTLVVRMCGPSVRIASMGSSMAQMALPKSRMAPQTSGPVSSIRASNSLERRSPAWFSKANFTPASRARERSDFMSAMTASTWASMPPSV